MDPHLEAEYAAAESRWHEHLKLEAQRAAAGITLDHQRYLGGQEIRD